MPKFGDLEAVVMDRVWAAQAPVLVRDVVEELRQNREIAYTTVQTVMDALSRKGWLRRERLGRANGYWPTASREDYTARLVAEALATTDDRTAALARYVEQMDPDEALALRQALTQARKSRP